MTIEQTVFAPKQISLKQMTLLLNLDTDHILIQSSETQFSNLFKAYPITKQQCVPWVP